jgi:hypothetical protein
MKLIDDAGAVWHRLWSVRLALLAAALDGANVLLGYLVPAHPRQSLAILAGGVAMAAAIARLVAQPKLRNDDDA